MLEPKQVIGFILNWISEKYTEYCKGIPHINHGNPQKHSIYVSNELIYFMNVINRSSDLDYIRCGRC
jgi:hypothetical protein